MRALLAGLRTVCVGDRFKKSGGKSRKELYPGQMASMRVKDPSEDVQTTSIHPLVRTHPETGRKSLYFDPGKIVGFVGIDDREGDELITALKERMIVPEAEYHHVWRKGDVVIWDNRCSYHKAAGDYPPEEDRIHWRVSINDYGVEAMAAQ
jgi:taurine dioxygenase